MKKYSSYKDSGIAWIGQIPSHWQTDKIGAHFDERKVKVSDKDYEPLSVTKDGIVPQLADAAKTDNGDNRKLVCAGDFVVNSRSDRKSSCGVSPFDGSVSLINIILASRDINKSYIHYLFRSNDYVEEFYRNGRGIVADLWTTRYSEMKNIFIPIPPTQEQDAIVRYITEKSEKIDRYIAEQELLLGALDELRQAEIARAVTRGLNPDAPLRDSGIDWIGSIPTHWRKDKVNRLFREIGSGTTPRNQAHYENGDIPWVNSGDLNYGFLYSVKKFVTSKAIEECSALKIYPIDTILIAMYGASIGKIAITKVEGCTNQACCALSNVADNIFLKYAFYILMSCKQKWVEDSFGGTQPNISAEKVKQTWIPIPPLEEQRAIVEYLDAKTAKIDRMKADVEKQIGLLKEYKQRMISDAVTGKIDVRE